MYIISLCIIIHYYYLLFRLTRDEMLRKTGELFALRHTMNLRSDLLDVPDFYWDRDQMERLYTQTSNYFSISKRTKVSENDFYDFVKIFSELF